MAAETIRAIRGRIRGVKNAQKIAKAMFLTASAKYRRAYTLMEDSRTFPREAQEITDILSAQLEKKGENSCCIVVAGDRGMSGGCNTAIIRRFREISAQYKCILPVGQKAWTALRECGSAVLCDQPLLSEKTDLSKLKNHASKLADMLFCGDIFALDIISTSFGGEIRTRTLVQSSHKPKENHALIYEPSADEILKNTLSGLLAGTIYAYICEANAQEQLSRRIAMDAAQNNAGDMLEKLKLRMNRLRRAHVTREIIEAAAGFAAEKVGG